jgi:hypothetical protein
LPGSFPVHAICRVKLSGTIAGVFRNFPEDSGMAHLCAARSMVIGSRIPVSDGKGATTGMTDA